MLLSDEQIMEKIREVTHNGRYALLAARFGDMVAEAQLIHCEPLIRAKVAQEIKREIKQYAGEACFDGSGDGCKYYMIYTKWWELFWQQYEVKVQEDNDETKNH